MEQGTTEKTTSPMERKLRDLFEKRFADFLIRTVVFRGELSFYIKPDGLIDICEALVEDDELDVKMLADVTSCDWLNTEFAADGRFEVVYNMLSLSHKFRFFIRCFLPEENPTIDSLVPIFAGANWMEREVWDLMGITFEGHPDLTKILTPDDLEGHPLRKDFPLTWEQPVFSWNKDDPPEVIK